LIRLLLAAAAGALAGAGGAAVAFDAIRRARTIRRGAAAALPAAALVGLSRVGARVSSRLGLGGAAAQRLAAAGLPARLGPGEWLGVKSCGAAATAACSIAGAGWLPGRMPLLALMLGPVAGFVAPDVWLTRQARRRLEAAAAELAPMLDLLQVTVEAGAAPGAALGAVGGRFTGPLAAEWRAAATAIALGTPHEQALAEVTCRLPSPRIRAFADAMRRAQRLGLPLVEVLGRQAAAARHDRRIRMRERAARAGPKIQLVVAFVLVPSVMLVVAAALIAELTAPGVGLTY